jgi:hypothetical protein
VCKQAREDKQGQNFSLLEKETVSHRGVSKLKK